MSFCGVGYFFKTAMEDLQEIESNCVSYSGNTLSIRAVILRLRSLAMGHRLDDHGSQDFSMGGMSM